MLALFAAAAVAAAPAPIDQMADLERMYQQSCSVKAYGSYDDLCSGLRKQMKEAQKRQKKVQAQQARLAARAEPAPSAPTSPPPALGFSPTKD
jgi:hypothetical protein